MTSPPLPPRMLKLGCVGHCVPPLTPVQGCEGARAGVGWPKRITVAGFTGERLFTAGGPHQQPAPHCWNHVHCSGALGH